MDEKLRDSTNGIFDYSCAVMLYHSKAVGNHQSSLARTLRNLNVHKGLHEHPLSAPQPPPPSIIIKEASINVVLSHGPRKKLGPRNPSSSGKDLDAQ